MALNDVKRKLLACIDRKWRHLPFFRAGMTSVSMAPHRSPPLPSTHWPMMESFLTTTTFSPSVRPQGRHCWLENIRYTWVGILSNERCLLTHWSMSKRLKFCRRHFYCILLKETACMMQLSLKIVPMVSIENLTALVMAWRRIGMALT